MELISNLIMLGIVIVEGMFTASGDELEVTKVTGGNVTVENGAIKAAFSISDSKQIYFSQGNLQYQASIGTWRFAEHQYDMIGNDNANISSSYSGWIDLFGWGTSGFNGKVPYMVSKGTTDYGDGENDIEGTNYDWGVYNKVSNGGNEAGMWRTLTKSEWNYLLNGRPHCEDLYSKGRIDGICGLILLPDEWNCSIGFSPRSENWKTNDYTLDEWSLMESNGAVFLPAAGGRDGTDVSLVGSIGYYWSGSAYDYYYADCLAFYGYGVSTDIDDRYTGHSVRLVRGL